MQKDRQSSAGAWRTVTPASQRGKSPSLRRDIATSMSARRAPLFSKYTQKTPRPKCDDCDSEESPISSFTSLDHRRRRNNPTHAYDTSPSSARSTSPHDDADGQQLATLRYLAFPGTGQSPSVELFEFLEHTPLDRVVDVRYEKVSSLVRALFHPCPVQRGRVPAFDYHGPVTNRVSNFKWSGPLYSFCDTSIPYEIARGQVIPFYFNESNGEIVYYSGVDSKFNEVAGFGGAIAGRRIRDTFTAGAPNEETVDGAFRELDEESIGIFRSQFTVEDACYAPTFVVDETLVILLRVRTDARDVRSRFAAAYAEVSRRNGGNVPTRENKGIIAATSEEMLDAIHTRTLRHFRLWDKYWKILDRLANTYKLTF